MPFNGLSGGEGFYCWNFCEKDYVPILSIPQEKELLFFRILVWSADALGMWQVCFSLDDMMELSCMFIMLCHFFSCFLAMDLFILTTEPKKLFRYSFFSSFDTCYA